MFTCFMEKKDGKTKVFSKKGLKAAKPVKLGTPEGSIFSFTPTGLKYEVKGLAETTFTLMASAGFFHSNALLRYSKQKQQQAAF